MENNHILRGHLLEFTAPSGYKFTIREQNGADDDVLSNAAEANNLMNVSRFLAGLVVNTDYTANGLLTAEDVHGMPVLDKWAILFHSRIHSLGNILDLEYDWGKENGGKEVYEQDLEEFLFDYSKLPTEEELNSKPDAIPYYPNGKHSKDIEFTTTQGHTFKFDLLTSHGQVYVAQLPAEKRTKNAMLIARNLRMEVNGNWDKVTNFAMFGVKEMREIRNTISSLDPTFSGNTTIQNSKYPELVTEVNLLQSTDFFYPGEI